MDPEDIFLRARETWNGATSGEKWRFVAAAAAATLVASSALTAVFNVITLMVFSVFALPFFAVAASLGVAFFAATVASFALFSVFGVVGFGFVGVPLLLTGSLVLKLVGPVVFAGLPALAWKRQRDAEREAEAADERFLDDDVGGAGDDIVDELEDFQSFDKQLRRRQAVSNMDVNTMSMNDLLEWSVDDALRFLRFSDLASAMPVFKSERIDGYALSTMDDSELREITEGLPLGDRKRLIVLVRRFRIMR